MGGLGQTSLPDPSYLEQIAYTLTSNRINYVQM